MLNSNEYIRIIQKLWKHIIDFKMLVNDVGNKTYEIIDEELKATEQECEWMMEE